MPTSFIDLAAGGCEVLTVLASGVAAEQFVFGDYDAMACRSDQEKICQYGGDIGTLLPVSADLVRAHESCLQQLREELTKKWVESQAECEAASNFAASANTLTFELLSGYEISIICPELADSHRGSGKDDIGNTGSGVQKRRRNR
jgi:hypothetical protein